jgi:hypothetical protein
LPAWNSSLQRGRERSGEGAQLRENVVAGLDQLRSLPDQLMTPACQRIVDRAGNREHFAALVGRQSGGDQRAAAHCRLDDQRTQRQPADDAIAPREVHRQRRRAERKFADECTACSDRFGERAVRGRVVDIQSGATHGNGDAFSIERTSMSCSVDAGRQPARDREPAASEMRREARGVVATARSGIARADDCQLRQRQSTGIAAHEQPDRCIGQLREQRRIDSSIERYEVMARALEPAQRHFDGDIGRAGGRMGEDRFNRAETL